MVWYSLGETINTQNIIYENVFGDKIFHESLSGKFIIAVLSSENLKKQGNSWIFLDNVVFVDDQGRRFFPREFIDNRITGFRENYKNISINDMDLYMDGPGLIDKSAYIFEVPHNVTRGSLEIEIRKTLRD
jgi:hypothetical protein